MSRGMEHIRLKLVRLGAGRPELMPDSANYCEFLLLGIWPAVGYVLRNLTIPE